MTGKQLEKARLHLAAAQNLLKGAERKDSSPVTGLPFVICAELKVLEQALVRIRKPAR